jgi:hypothetical protein
MQDRLTAAEAHTNAYREHLPKADLKKIEDANKAEVNQKDAETSAAKMTPDVVNKLVEAINLHPDKIDQIKKTFTSKYPGLKMEDYVKINLPTNQTQVTNVTEDSLVPSENVKPLPKKININQRPTSIVEDTKTAIVSRMGPVKDPMTGEMITRSEFRKKYGVSPK